MLLSRHRDRPGAIGLIGGALGEADINISSMHLARNDPAADAFMLLAVDDEVPAETIARLQSLDAVIELWLINLE